MTNTEFLERVNHLIELSPKDQQQIMKALEFGANAHTGQTRASGENYFTGHCMPVAIHVAELGLSANMIIAALLHDTIEDTSITHKDIRKEFNKTVADLVEGVSKLGKLKYRGNERHVESLRKFFVAATKDVRVIILKLCDRWHNLETLEYLPEEKRKRIALESMMIHGALASRLNMGKLTNAINDLAFPYAMPEEYEKTLSLRESFLKQ